MLTTLKIGTAGWSIPSAVADRFPEGASHLARYAQRLAAVEINSSFHRPHQIKTYARWADTAPETFRFAVKLPKTITHERRLVGAEDLQDRFLAEIAPLGRKLGPILVQLPPSLAYDPIVVAGFLGSLRERFDGQLACEPRHASWFSDEADLLLASLQVARVAADPALSPRAAAPGGWTGLSYRRLHGSPKTYYSDYTAERLHGLAADLSMPSAATESWCIFDNTTLGYAAANALALQELMRAPGDPSGLNLK